LCFDDLFCFVVVGNSEESAIQNQFTNINGRIEMF